MCAGRADANDLTCYEGGRKGHFVRRRVETFVEAAFVVKCRRVQANAFVQGPLSLGVGCYK